jgi:hypothetical protein
MCPAATKILVLCFAARLTCFAYLGTGTALELSWTLLIKPHTYFHHTLKQHIHSTQNNDKKPTVARPYSLVKPLFVRLPSIMEKHAITAEMHSVNNTYIQLCVRHFFLIIHHFFLIIHSIFLFIHLIFLIIHRSFLIIQ